MKKIFLIVAGLFILTSCASSDSLAQTAPTCIKPDCSISSIHHHAW